MLPSDHTKGPQSWGRYPKVKHTKVMPIYWPSDVPDLEHTEQPVLTHAYGRSYSDNFLDDNAIVRHYDGAIYPAKDVHMSAESFQQFFPRLQEFAQYIDPHFSSSFWRRVSAKQ